MSSSGVLFLFADTNVFLQCKPLKDVDWSAFGAWERIDVVITRPVQTEIDSLKDGGNARRAARSRQASALIDQLIDADDSRLRVRDQPRVDVCLRHDLRRDESVSDVLDYRERDDQLVGTALAFAREQPAGEVRLLSNDTGPKASAKMVGLKHFAIPAEWLLAPEPDEAEKQLTKLKAENDRLRSQEPAVELEALEPHSEKVHNVLQLYTPLEPSQLDELMAVLARRFPLATDFGPTHAEERSLGAPGTVTASILGQRKERYEPVSAERISEYRAKYEEWREACKTALDDLPEALNKHMEWPRLTVRIRKTGTRPAEDALVVLNIAGRLFLMPPRREADDADDENGDEKVNGPVSLPRPPVAPTGIWRRVDPFALARGPAIADILAMQRANYPSFGETYLPTLPFRPEPRDPNEFYFKEGRRGRPAQRVSYECEQWRHAQAPEDFEVAVLCPAKPGKHAGLITVTVHAANLTDPCVLRIPVSLEVEELPCYDQAKRLVDMLR